MCGPQKNVNDSERLGAFRGGVQEFSDKKVSFSWILMIAHIQIAQNSSGKFLPTTRKILRFGRRGGRNC